MTTGMGMILMVGRGGVILAYSKKLARMARDATRGLTDSEVMRLTGLSYATWRRILDGRIPGPDKLAM
jgi:hypothetical protein